MTHVCEVVGLNPGPENWMDNFSHWFVVKIYFLFEKTKNKQKEAGVGQFKKTGLNLSCNTYRNAKKRSVAI